MKAKDFQLSRLKHTTAMILVDAVLISLAWFISYWLRFNLSLPPAHDLSNLIILLPAAIIVQTLSACFFGVYRGVWRYTSTSELIKIIKSAVTTSTLLTLFVFFSTEKHILPRSIPFLFAIMNTMFLGGSRVTYRLLKDYGIKSPLRKRVLIVGAGAGAETLIRNLQRNNEKGYQLVGLIDDDPKKLGKEIHGVRVIGNIAQLHKIARQTRTSLILIAMPSAGSEVMQRIVAQCEKTHISYRTLPSLNDIATGRASVTTIREVVLEDLLSRNPVESDPYPLTNAIKNKTVLITGGGGSIGSELCQQIVQLSPSQLIVVDNNEHNLYTIEQKLSKKMAGANVSYQLISVTDKSFVEQLLAHHKPNAIFHAAAYKHVPLLEEQPSVAIQNNIRGTEILANAAIAANVEKFILISTDKAVNPSNVMGASKRGAELICQYLSTQQTTAFITVRFGNVLGSAGSVIPLFKKQIAQGGPVTVTHPDITRYFMTIPEACHLILQAARMGNSGDLFVLDMGKPVKIQYLAEQLIKIANNASNKAIKIEYIGLRPGEKLYEELHYEKEKLMKSNNEKIFYARTPTIDTVTFERKLKALYAASLKDNDSIRSLLFGLISPTTINHHIEQKA